ncbi:MAG: AAA family ATPase [Hyphomonas sp.]|uniref:AAA family ATPase n=1 Tax=Hyphomonas sp. TaxID=87 RepID=UPI0030022853
MTHTTPEPMTEAAAFAALVKWSQERPSWQRDALRRLIQIGALTDQDVEELATICLDSSAPCQPLDATHISMGSTSSDPITLRAVRAPTGVNALAADQSLEFAPAGLTIIYGDNGSGKSGYVRILKHACRTRDSKVVILRDVEDKGNTPQKATITLGRGAVTEDFAWTPSAAGHPDLPSVSIFDARSANIHVEKTNAVAYIPQPMQVLETLATTCDDVKAKLTAKQAVIKGQTPKAVSAPSLREDTAAGQFIRRLSAESSLSELGLLSTLSEDETKRLTSLEADFAQDPKRAVERLKNQAARLQNGVEKVRSLVDAASDSVFKRRDSLASIHTAKTEAANAASQTLFAASPLPDVGKEAWRNLWQAARRYADEVAYPNKTFPEAEQDKDLCVLCQQPLGGEAVARRLTFEEFVKGSTRADEEQAAAAMVVARKSAAAASMPIAAIRQLCALVATELADKVLAADIRRSALTAAWRLRALLRNEPQSTAQAAVPVASLDALHKDLVDRLVKLAADHTSDAYKELLQEFRELKDREQLAPIKADIVAEIVRRKELAAIDKALKETAKNAITSKNKDISDALVTNALRDRFAREIEKLKLSRMPVELRKKDQKAVSYFQVCLVEKPDEPVGEIFSEGEHRCVALAAFLAELVTSKRYSGIVFDDPMSSLDHIHRRAVAARLVEEAAHRQVIIFTHDLAFLYELRREAEAKECPAAYQTVRRRPDRPGYVAAELPDKAKSGLQLTNALRSELKAAKPHYDSWNDTKRTNFAKGMIAQLREAWEQGVADFIRPVLGRFDNHVKAGSLFKLAILTAEDVIKVLDARRQLSEELHASATTLNPETVKHTELLQEVGKLEAWLQDIAQRQKDAQP